MSNSDQADITSIQLANPPIKEEKIDEVEDQQLEISVSDPHKVREGLSSYVVYKVTTKTNLPYFRKKTFSVSRRFSDFLGLHEKLIERHLNVGRIVPPAPEKSVIAMTKVKMSKDETLSSDDLIEKRRAALERFLNRIASHPALRMDPDFRNFLETEFDLPKATNTSALSAAGALQLFNRVGDTLNKMTLKMDETDTWFDERQKQIENLQEQLKKLHCSVEDLVQQRKAFSMSTGAFAKSAAKLANCEQHPALSRALSQLAEVEEKIEQLQNQQANRDFYTLSESVKDYISLLTAIKELFYQRVKLYQAWQNEKQILKKKVEQKAKLESAGKNDKLSETKGEIVECEANVEKAQQQFENISKVIREEFENFEQARVEEFKTTMIKYIKQLLEAQQQVVEYWESFLPEAKAIH